ncbi:MAG TPA: c-type cytochrome domain-containing protein [Dongiaceae bacterium]|nr:c-type cytochrome domain-containing protein [Dongiaceae bacterium]
MSKITALLLFGLAAAGWTASAADKMDFSKLDLSKLPPAAQKKGLSYSQDIRPLLEASCLRCHGQERPKAGLQLDSLEGALKGGEDGKVVVPGNSKKSLLVIAAAQIDDETAMPPKRGPGRGRRGGFGGPPGGGGGPGGPGGPAGPGGGPRGPGGPGGFGPPPKPLTAEQVGLLRAWVDQGAQ